MFGSRGRLLDTAYFKSDEAISCFGVCVFRELLRSEASLAKLYCRMALLNIFAPKSPHMFTRLFHIPAIRDITLEHLQLLSNQLLAPPLPGKL